MKVARGNYSLRENARKNVQVFIKQVQFGHVEFNMVVEYLREDVFLQAVLKMNPEFRKKDQISNTTEGSTDKSLV